MKTTIYNLALLSAIIFCGGCTASKQSNDTLQSLKTEATKAKQSIAAAFDKQNKDNNQESRQDPKQSEFEKNAASSINAIGKEADVATQSVADNINRLSKGGFNSSSSSSTATSTTTTTDTNTDPNGQSTTQGPWEKSWNGLDKSARAAGAQLENGVNNVGKSKNGQAAQ